jgi:hypothetical protein
MNFLRRLIGLAPDSTAPKTKPPEPAMVERPAPEITGPESAVDTTPPAPVIQAAPPDAAAAPVAPTPDPFLFGATRQLPPIESFVGKPGKHVTYGLNSDVGIVRNNNQDSLYAMFSSHISADGLPDFGLFVVADGMGGHHDGERASAIAARVIEAPGRCWR